MEFLNKWPLFYLIHRKHVEFLYDLVLVDKMWIMKAEDIDV